MKPTIATSSKPKTEKSKGNRGVLTSFQGLSRYFTDIGTPKQAYLMTTQNGSLFGLTRILSIFVNSIDMFFPLLFTLQATVRLCCIDKAPAIAPRPKTGSIPLDTSSPHTFLNIPTGYTTAKRSVWMSILNFFTCFLDFQIPCNCTAPGRPSKGPRTDTWNQPRHPQETPGPKS